MYYDSPVTITYEDPAETMIEEMQEEQERRIVRCIQKMGVNIDKDKLVQALTQDQKRYDEAYRKGWDAGYDTALHDCANYFYKTVEDLNKPAAIEAEEASNESDRNCGHL